MTNKIDLAKIPEPAWLKQVAPNSCMNAKDLADIFKLKPSTLYLKVAKGEFPKPDITHIVGRSFYEGKTFSNKCQWRISTVRKFFKQTKGE
jgi:hypothetical protein